MNFITKNKWFAVAFLVLILLNIATLSAFWWMKKDRAPEDRPPQNGAMTFLVKELNLDSLQQEQLKVLRDEHRMASQDARKNNKEAKEKFFSLLQNDEATEAAIDEAAKLSVQYDQVLTRNTFDHFKKIRAMCTPAQKKKFDAIINEVLRMMNGLQGPPPPREGGMHHPPPGGPPPREMPEPEK